MDAPGTLAFRGRTSESRELEGLLKKVGAGESAAVVVRGEAGIGKTALLDQCVEQARARFGYMFAVPSTASPSTARVVRPGAATIGKRIIGIHGGEGRSPEAFAGLIELQRQGRFRSTA